MGRLIEIFNSTCPESSYSCTTRSCKLYFTYCYHVLRSQLCMGLICEAAPAISHGVYVPVLSLSSKYFFPEISFGSHPNEKRRTVSSSVALRLAQPQRSLWPPYQSQEQMQVCLSLLILSCVTLPCAVVWINPAAPFKPWRVVLLGFGFLT